MKYFAGLGVQLEMTSIRLEESGRVSREMSAIRERRALVKASWESDSTPPA
jgi:hypothetical protein